jgi:GABA permease
MHANKHSILLIANETVASPLLRDAILAQVPDLETTEVVVVAPALNTRLRHWLSDDDEARAEAERRVAACVKRLAAGGIAVQGWVGDADPLQSIRDALYWGPDVLIISTHPEGRSNWLSHDIVARARARFGLPVVHIVVDPGAGREYVADRSGAPLIHARLARAA